jgi:mannose-6-phosphate isomerase-like protein (cupin superfamily)
MTHLESDQLAPRLIAADEGQFVRLRELGVRYLVRGDQTGGRFAEVEHPLGPRRLGAPPHTHTHEDEVSFVVEGTIGVRIGEQIFTAGPGATVIKPRGVPHAFRNAGDTPARVLEIISPAGFEDYFEEMAAVFADAGDGPPDGQRMAVILAKYALRLDLDSIPILTQRHRLGYGKTG